MKLRMLLIFSAIYVAGVLQAQQPVPTASELFHEARSAAFDQKDHVKAKALATQALSLAPFNADIQVFLGRLYAWDKQYDSSRFHLKHVLAYAPLHEDAYLAYTDLEVWNGHQQLALEVCNKGLAVYPTSVDLLVKKAGILQGLKQYQEAWQVIEQVTKQSQHHPAANALATSIKDAMAVNSVAVRYNFSHLDNLPNQPWHMASVAYTRQSSFGPITGSIHYAKRYGTNGWQAELEAYPRINKTFYSYVNFGYSPGDRVFPRSRGGLSLIANLPRGFEAEAGVRYLHFDNTTWLYTLYAGKYYKKFLFGARMYVSPNVNSSAQTFNFTGRYYLKGADDYVGISLGSGISPDDRATNIQFNNKSRLHSKQATVNFQHRVWKRNYVTLHAGFLRQAYENNVSMGQLDVMAGYQVRF
ncbi:YaiO family outer membrane beta-barrel protein [Aridibaculum aurantiacum]|uniref:YaiO family outer membrane beta-barrel protein n=1 Tax=Aridibaculum aurantiacum TaxID=2810307 RepID=UPI001A968A7E|nr:YaiO family outer membrane beta-barrel protein [Aridibaculum aurantiacum]